MAYNEGDIADGPDGQSLVFKGGRWVSLRATAPAIGGPITIGSPSPTADLQRPKGLADLGSTLATTDRTRASAALDSAKLPTAPAQAAADLLTTNLNNQRLAKQLAQGDDANRQSAATRAAAINRFQQAELLSKRIDDLQTKFNNGPGGTSGLASIRDFLPYTENTTFDDSSNAVRGLVGTALGFTGGQLNTEREAENAVGPYLPKSNLTDGRAQARIDRLRDLAATSRSTAISELGGIPDANGNIQPLRAGVAANIGQAGSPPNVPPAGGGINPPVPSGGNGGLPQGIVRPGDTTRAVDDSADAAREEQMIRNGASPADLQAAFPNRRIDPSQVLAAQRYLKSHPDYSGFVQATHDEPTTLRQRAAGSPLGALVAGASDAIVPAGLIGGDTKRATDALQQAYPGYSLAGAAIGGIPAAAGAELGAARLLGRGGMGVSRLADAAYGAYQGGGNADPGEGAVGALAGGAAGVFGGEVGRRAVSGLGAVIGGVGSDALRTLRDRNVDTTVGQALGGTVKDIEDQLTGYPLIGGIIRARRGEARQGLNRAAFDEGLAPIGASTNGVIGEAGIDAARTARNAGYRRALDGVSLTPDQQFGTDFSDAVTAGRRLPSAAAEQTNFGLRTAGEQVDPITGQLDGDGLQQAIRVLRRTASSNKTAINGPDIGDVLRQGEDAFTGLVDRQSPTTSAALGAANQTHRNVEILRAAVDAAKNNGGEFSPAQLINAANSNARKFGGTNGTTQQPFYDLSRAASEALPSKTGDPGTAARLLLGTALVSAAGGGGAAGYGESGSPLGAGGGSLAGLAGLGGAAALGGSRSVQRGLVKLLADRPDLLRRLGDTVSSRSGLLGGLGIGPATTVQSLLTTTPPPTVQF